MIVEIQIYDWESPCPTPPSKSQILHLGCDCAEIINGTFFICLPIISEIKI